MLFSKQLSLIVGAGLFLIISGNRENIALNKTATQSSTLNWSGYLWQASFATDGNTGFSDSCRCCSGTEINSYPSWLEVDLEREYEIGRIDVYGRNDNVIVQLQGFNLYISNHSHSLTGPIYQDSESNVEQYLRRGGHYTIKVGELRGRYVTVSKYVTNLMICELQVFQACTDGQYEPNCTACNCGGRPCIKSNGSCSECPDGHYGVNCSSCGHCLHGNLTCNKTTGQCHEGCAAGYTGPKCYQECPNGSYGIGCISCGHCLHGNISCDKVTGLCPGGCAAGYTGPTCKQECPAGSFGVNCSSCGHCLHGNISCDKVNGQCRDGCEIGFTGQTCHHECFSLHFGPNCSHTCHCINGTRCNHVYGSCDKGECDPGWRGSSCDTECVSPSFGHNCSHTCHCINNSGCNHRNGICDLGLCEPGWQGSSCSVECVSPSFGPNCSLTCHCKDGSYCHHVDGTCDQGECDPGWRGPSCDIECASPSFGPACSQTCHCLKGSRCDHVVGICDLGICDPGWKGFSCDRECDSPYFGPKCSFTCHCANKSHCDHVSGTCDSGLCETGWQGPSCDQDADLLPMIRQRLTVSMSIPVYLDMNASLAIDRTDGTLPDTCHCCSFTTAGDSWWRLELGQMYPIRGVRLIGRSDSIYQNGHYVLQLSNTSLPTVEFRTPQSVTGKPHVFYWDLSDILASTITIVRSNLLIICSINVYEGECRVGYYGTSCELECQCVNNKSCNRTTGTCSTSGCKPGWRGQDCSQETTQISMQDGSNSVGFVITVVVLAVTCVVQTGCIIVLWIKLRRTRTNTINKKTKSCSIPETSYVNEMVERVAARPALPKIPGDNLKPVNVDCVSVDVHSDYQSLYDREITEGIYSKIQ